MKKAGILLGTVAIAGACLLPVSGEIVRAAAYTETKEYVSRLQLSPTVVTQAASKEAYEAALTAANKPRSVMLGVGQNGLTAEDESTVGTVKEVFDELAENAILPVIRIDSLLQLQTFAAEATANGYFDFAITGDNVGVLKSTTALLPESRVYVDFSAEEGYEDAYDYIRDCREAGGHVIILSQKQADWDTVYYLQSMTMTVWVRAAEESEFGFASAISTGAYGIIADDYATLFKTYDSYPVYSLPRGYYIAGHRGLPYSVPENTLESFIAAYEAGATHIELDVQTTADKKLVIMHDAVLESTTDGSGAIANMTLEEIQRFKVIRTKDAEPTGDRLDIPTLGDVFEYFKGKDIVLIVEIKDAAQATCELIKQELERYGTERQTISISFYDGAGSQLEKMHEVMPSLPIATLVQVTESNCDGYLKKAARWNMTFAPSYNEGYATFFNSNFKDRGYIAWGWTYKDVSPVQMGMTGITHDYADLFRSYAKRLITPEGLSIEEGEDLTKKTFSVQKRNFGGDTETVQAKVFVSEKTQGGYRAILRVEERDEVNYGRLNLYTQPVFIAENKTEPEPGLPPADGAKNNTALIVGLSCGGAVLVAGIAVAAVFLVKRKKR